MKKLTAVVLLLALFVCFTACEKDVEIEESGDAALQTYRLPTEWTVTGGIMSYSYEVSYEGSTATLTKGGETVLVVTLDESGNAIYREDADGAKLEAVYNETGNLTETLLWDKYGTLQRRTEYDEHGRAVREYARGRYGDSTLRTFTYGESGELLTEVKYSSLESHTYEYHANGALAAEASHLLECLPAGRREYDEAGTLTREYKYDRDGRLTRRREYDEEGNVMAEYDGEGNLQMNERKEKVFDEHGNLTECNYYNNDGSLNWRMEYDYDEHGNEIAEREYVGEDGLRWEWFYTYDEAGSLTNNFERFYDSRTGELEYAAEFEWDAFGNNTKSVVYDPEGNITSDTVREFASIGGKWVVTASRSYNGEKTLVSRVDNTYDERGNLTEEVVFDGDGNVDYRRLYVYDEQNNLLEDSYYKGDTLSTHSIYENTYAYDEAGRVVRHSAARLESRLTYAYESGSGLLKEIVRDGDGNVIRTYETVCDNNGNPRIRQSTEQGYTSRYEYEWSPEGGLRTCVWSENVKEVSRLQAGSYVSCTLTETQYRNLLELLLMETGSIYKPGGLFDDYT